MDYYNFRPKKINNIEYWRLSNDCYDNKSWLWRKIKDKQHGLCFLGKDYHEIKEEIKSILFKLKLSAVHATYVQRSYVGMGDVERSIWFSSDEDFKNAVDLLEKEQVNE